MPDLIVKLQDGNKVYYLLWSTVVDAPISDGMRLSEFKKYYESKYGASKNTLSELKERLGRVEETGTSARGYASAEELIKSNRAGPNESCLTIEQILDRYCRKVRD